MTLNDLVDMRAGTFIAASSISRTQDRAHMYPCYGGGGLRGYVREANQQGDCLLIGRQGALCGNVQRAKGLFYATEHCVVARTRAQVDNSWAFHLLTAMNLNQFASRSAQPGLAVGAIGRLGVSVPPRAEQERVGATLDAFDSLVNVLSVELPAELKARRQQYEYYRDRLLTFEEAVA
jgi:type I restriction enzyme S subunit